LLAAADLADRIGCGRVGRDPAAALPWFRDAAVYAMFALATAGPADAEDFRASRAIARHDHAVEELLECAGAGSRGGDPGWRGRLASVGVRVAVMNPARAGIPCDELWLARDFRVTHLDRNGRDGLGVPLIAVSQFHRREVVPDRFYPERLRLPATAVLRPGGPPEGGAWRSRPVTLGLHDPSKESVIVRGALAGEIPLAADWTTPLAHQFIETPLASWTFGGLIRPGDYAGSSGLFMQAPHERGKIPVLFVHGLSSNPGAWLVMVNRLQAEPLLRERYEFWYAFYPTGAPLMVSAVRLRRELRELRAAIDPFRDDPALDRMVVVGHSLGGVLSKQLLQGSGRALENALLTRPFDQVQMSPESRETLARLLYFEPERSVARAVFLAAPHRGSNVANRWIGRLSSLLVDRAEELESLHAEVLGLNGPEAINPAYRRRPPSSIDNLEMDSPILTVLSELPIAPGIPYHSIVGNLFPAAPTRYWTDGVVPYASAHLEGAASEIMVKHDHTVNDAPEAIAEVRRILRLHVGIP
jgi:pimeloyl-ACP methyl ester carboxylesterase